MIECQYDRVKRGPGPQVADRQGENLRAAYPPFAIAEQGNNTSAQCFCGGGEWW